MREAQGRDVLLEAAGSSRGRRGGLILGVGAFPGAVPPLPFAEADACAVHAALTDPQGGVFDADEVELLAGPHVSRGQLWDALGRLRRADPRELVLIYLATHGVVQAREGYFLLADSDPRGLRRSAVSTGALGSWLGELRARDVVVMVDACHALSLSSRSWLDSLSELRAGDGRIILASCGVDQRSLEVEGDGHGLFTKHLLRGLAGEADHTRRGVVTALELFHYVQSRVEGEAAQLGHRQVPTISGVIGSDVVLGHNRLEPEAGTIRRLDAPRLLLLDSEGRSRLRFRLDRETITVGRHPDCDLQVIADLVLRRSHAAFRRTPGGWILDPEGAPDRTWVWGTPVQSPRVLEHGDEIQLGKTRFRYLEAPRGRLPDPSSETCPALPERPARWSQEDDLAAVYTQSDGGQSAEPVGLGLGEGALEEESEPRRDGVPLRDPTRDVDLLQVHFASEPLSVSFSGEGVRQNPTADESLAESHVPPHLLQRGRWVPGPHAVVVALPPVGERVSLRSALEALAERARGVTTRWRSGDHELVLVSGVSLAVAKWLSDQLIELGGPAPALVAFQEVLNQRRQFARELSWLRKELATLQPTREGSGGGEDPCEETSALPRVCLDETADDEEEPQEEQASKAAEVFRRHRQVMREGAVAAREALGQPVDAGTAWSWLQALTAVAWADGRIGRRERVLLGTAARRWDVGAEDVERIVEETRYRSLAAMPWGPVGRALLQGMYAVAECDGVVTREEQELLVRAEELAQPSLELSGRRSIHRAILGVPRDSDPALERRNRRARGVFDLAARELFEVASVRQRSGAGRLLECLRQLAALDGHVCSSEEELLVTFAQVWGDSDDVRTQAVRPHVILRESLERILWQRLCIALALVDGPLAPAEGAALAVLRRELAGNDKVDPHDLIELQTDAFATKVRIRFDLRPPGPPAAGSGRWAVVKETDPEEEPRVAVDRGAAVVLQSRADLHRALSGLSTKYGHAALIALAAGAWADGRVGTRERWLLGHAEKVLGLTLPPALLETPVLLERFRPLALDLRGVPGSWWPIFEALYAVLVCDEVFRNDERGFLTDFLTWVEPWR